MYEAVLIFWDFCDRYDYEACCHILLFKIYYSGGRDECRR